jgi:N6-adenosine-specific RNA methylase IME4
VSAQPRELRLLEEAKQYVAEATTIDDVKKLLDAAEAARWYQRKVDLTGDITLDAGIINVYARQRMGQVLNKIELAKGAPGNQYTGKRRPVRFQTATGPFYLDDLTITKSDSSKAKQIASLPGAIVDKYVKDCVESRQQPTPAGLLRLVKQKAANDTVLPESHSSARFVRDLRELVAKGRRFPTIYADPPWKYDNQGTRAATDQHYPTMTVEQIAAEPVAQLAADRCHLHMWTTTSFVPAALSIIPRWGFEYKSMLIWVKPSLGIGNYWRVSHEILLFASTRNAPFRDHGQRSWIELDRQGHSEKPEEIRTLIEKVSEGPYLEMYSRVLPKNAAWTVHGNQLLKELK